MKSRPTLQIRRPQRAHHSAAEEQANGPHLQLEDAAVVY
jgi:hypothetical protein